MHDFICLLNKHNVDYVIIGAHAMAHYGYVRNSGDIDVMIARDSSNCEKMGIVLKEFGFGNANITQQDLEKQYAVIQLGVDPNRIDILNDIDGVEYPEIKQHHTTGTVHGEPIKYIGLEQLIANKRSTGCSKDEIDVVQLLSIKEKMDHARDLEAQKQKRTGPDTVM